VYTGEIKKYKPMKRVNGLVGHYLVKYVKQPEIGSSERYRDTYISLNTNMATDIGPIYNEGSTTL